MLPSSALFMGKVGIEEMEEMSPRTPGGGKASGSGKIALCGINHHPSQEVPTTGIPGAFHFPDCREIIPGADGCEHVVSSGVVVPSATYHRQLYIS
jgi:hypothetical protein